MCEAPLTQETPPEVKTVDIPDEFLKKVQQALAPYSVAIARVKGNDASTFRPLGTGAFVKRGDCYGVLTAHHCLHQCAPEVKLGGSEGDTLLFIMNNGRQMVVQSIEVVEMPLGVPMRDELGPDLTFIRVLSPDRISTIKAVGLFWDLQQDPSAISEKFSKPKTPLASIGFPEINYNTDIKGFDIHHGVCNMTYLNAIGEGDIHTNDDWDYIDLSCTYTDTNNLPPSFAGVSGGPVWAYQLNVSRSTGEYSIGDIALVGIKFFETDLNDAKRKLRAHFIHSIYERAWCGTPCSEDTN